MKTIFLTLLFAIMFYPAQAQIKIQRTDNKVKAIIVDQVIEDTDIYAIFGVPLSVDSHQDEAAGGYMRSYNYLDLRINTVDRKLYDFAFNSVNYTLLINNRYKFIVGDLVDPLLALIPSDEVTRSDRDNTIQLFFKLDNSQYFCDSSLILTITSSGRIASVRWYSPV